MNMLPDFDDMGMEYEDEDDVEINVNQRLVKNRRDQEKRKQTQIDKIDPYKKEMRTRAMQKFASMKPPTYHELQVTQLKKVVKHTEDLMKNYKEDCAKYERSVMADGWTDKREKTLINFLVNCSKETMFVELVDASSYSKDRKKLFKLLDKFVEKVEKENVVQVITDSAAANVLKEKNLSSFLASKLAAHNL
ncbi:hypothetical protein ACSBR2_041543 [Camellia fascicularis]